MPGITLGYFFSCMISEPHVVNNKFYNKCLLHYNQGCDKIFSVIYVLKRVLWFMFLRFMFFVCCTSSNRQSQGNSLSLSLSRNGTLF